MAEERGLRRWSRLKRRAKDGRAKETQAKETNESEEVPIAVAAPSGDVVASGEDVTELDEEDVALPEGVPDPDTLDKDSDFTVFLSDTVPEAIRRKALRVLWRSDPVLANLDGLVDYGEDYASIGAVVGEAVATAYRVGKGYVGEGEETDETEDDLDDNGDVGGDPVSDDSDDDDPRGVASDEAQDNKIDIESSPGIIEEPDRSEFGDGNAQNHSTEWKR